jgi:hypothetical protein
VRKLLYILFLFVCFKSMGQTQTVSQTFVDRCTGETTILTVNFVNGSAVVAFYNRVKTFTWGEYTNGALETWLNETYAWWSNLSPCSTNTATNQTTQQTTTNATSSATNAAANATSTTGGTTSTTTRTASTNTSSTSTESTNTSNGNTDSTSSSSSSGSSDSSNSSSTSSGGESEGDSSNDSKKDTSDTSGEESTEESNNESESPKDSENEESESEKIEEESSEESEEERSKEEEKEEKKEEKKKHNPISVAANIMTQSGLDGRLTQAASFGFSQSSLTGTTTYSANVMVWDNLKQFSLNLSLSDVYFKYDKEVDVMIDNPFTNKQEKLGSYWTKGSIMMIQSVSANFMYIYGTKVASFGLSNVYLGQKENFWKGFVGGYALSGTIINVENNVMVMSSGVLFGTKPFPTKRVTISPMLALAINPVSYSFNTKDNVLKGNLVWNEHITYIVGSNFDVGLTQRFRFNIGGNIIGTTLPGIPLTWSATVGSKFQF